MTKIFFKEWTVKGAYPHFSDFFSEKEFEDSFMKWLEKKSEIVTEPHDALIESIFPIFFLRRFTTARTRYSKHLFLSGCLKNGKIKIESLRTRQYLLLRKLLQRDQAEKLTRSIQRTKFLFSNCLMTLKQSEIKSMKRKQLTTETTLRSTF